jgi:hypothetical protein
MLIEKQLMNEVYNITEEELNIDDTNLGSKNK